MGFFLVVLLIPLVIFLIFYPVYLGLISHKDLILKKLAGVDALLKKRHVYVNRIIDAVEDKMPNEEAVIQKVKILIIRINKLVLKWDNNEDRFNLENELDVELNTFLTAAVNYPEIKNNIYIKKDLDDFIMTQTLLMKAVTEFNTTLSNYKMLINSPPGQILAPMVKAKCKFVPYYIPEG